MAAKIISNAKLSKVLLNDSRELIKNQSKASIRRLFGKVNSPMKNYNSKSKFYQRNVGKSKRFSAFSKPPKRSEWRAEYDIWMMLMQGLHQNSTDAPFNQNKVIGVQDSSNRVQLIDNQQDFNNQILISSNGLRTPVNQLINPAESDVSLKVKVKLVPIVEGFTLVKNSSEISYTFDAGTKDINNNDDEIYTSEEMDYDSNESFQQQNKKIDQTLNSSGSTLRFMSTTDTFDDTPIPSFGFSSFETVVHVSQMSPILKYSEFRSAFPNASSTFIEENEGSQQQMKKPKRQEKTFSDSPIPHFYKKRKPDLYQRNRDDALDLMNQCQKARAMIQSIGNELGRLENMCGNMVNRQYSSDISISGINLLSDTMQL